MSDVVLLSSIFTHVKIAEPMAVCILAACLREKGFDVEILEPSIDGWSVETAVDEVAARKAPIVGISIHRDKNVYDVLKFVTLLRARCPDRFIVAGGHGPSIAVGNMARSRTMGDLHCVPCTPSADLPGSPRPNRERLAFPIIETAMEDASRPDPPEAAGVSIGECKSDGDENPELLSSVAASPYYDKSREYMSILQHIDTYVVGESDTNLPILVERVLKGEHWEDVPGLAYLNQENRLSRNPPPPKVPDLDTLPHPARDVLLNYQTRYGKSIPASILASRGCYYRCTFCSVAEYERLQEGPMHRRRSNDDIIAEIKSLHGAYGVTHFNFEDDNFLLTGSRAIEELRDLCDRLMVLGYEVSFTLFCRPDAVSADLFSHLKRAGLVGVYLGVESVSASDLEFFDKRATVGDNYRALDTLLSLGFSARVGSDLRIMLGYITWYPLTSFESLRATSRFVQAYEAPPKLLRRKLRLYCGSRVIDQVRRLNLLNPTHRHGWNFKDPRVEGLDSCVDDYFKTINRTRDRLRTLEKAASDYGYMVQSVEDVSAVRMDMDDMLYQYFDEIVELAERSPEGASSPAVAEFDMDMKRSFDTFMAERGVRQLIADGYAACGFADEIVDLFRK